VREDYSADGNAWEYFTHDHARSRAYRWNEPAPIHVLPHLWYRNTWSWSHGSPRPAIHAATPGAARTEDPGLGARWWYVRAEDGKWPVMLFTENETDVDLLFGAPNPGPYMKDGINDAVVHGLRDRVNEERGSKAAAHLCAMVGRGQSFTVQIRLAPESMTRPFAHFDAVFARRLREADEFYAGLHAPRLSEDERRVQRQAFAGLLWSKQFYHYDVHHWLAGDPAPPPERWQGRNRDWALHFRNARIVLMPDKWEYPWFASAYEWDFNAVNPPVVAWAVWQIGLWNEEHRFYFDVIRHDRERVPLKIYSMVGLVPLFAATVVEPAMLARLPVVMQTVGDALNSREYLRSILPTFVEPGEGGTRLLSVVDRDRLASILERVFDPEWRDYVTFHEYFHGDSGAGLGAGHQTGWTALVALLLQYRGRLCFERLRAPDDQRATALREHVGVTSEEGMVV
jgi:hypothetical protein